MAKTNKKNFDFNDLTLDAINDIAKNQFMQNRVVVSVDDTDYEVMIDNKFSIEKIQEVIKEFIEVYSKDVFEKIIADATEKESEKIMPEEILTYLFFLIVKHFTNIEVCKTASTYEDQMKVYSILLNLNIIAPVLEAFETSEIERMLSFITTALNNFHNMIESDIEKKSKESDGE